MPDGGIASILADRAGAELTALASRVTRSHARSSRSAKSHGVDSAVVANAFTGYGALVTMYTAPATGFVVFPARGGGLT